MLVFPVSRYDETVIRMNVKSVFCAFTVWTLAQRRILFRFLITFGRHKCDYGFCNCFNRLLPGGDFKEARGLNILTCIRITVEVDYRQAFGYRRNPYGKGQNV